MKAYEGYVKLADGRTQLMEVMAPDAQTARTMLGAFGECRGVSEKPQPVRW